MSDDSKQPFMSHLEELRQRFIKSFIAVGVAFCVAYYFVEDLFSLLITPLTKVMPEGSSLIFTSLTEMFFTYLKTAFIAGILLASPMIFLPGMEIHCPGLYQNEKRYVIPFVISSTILFVSGALFGFFVVFPIGFKFFLGYTNENLKAMPRFNSILVFL